MKNFSKNQKRILMLIFALVVLTGCIKQPDPNVPSDYYSLATSFSEVWSVSKFNAIFVLPITYIINFVIETLDWGIILGIGIATVLVNLITMPIMLYSQTNSSKMQLLQPQINKIEKKYEGRTDQQSMMQKTQETQKLYKDNDIKMGMMLLGSFLPFPLLMAMLAAVYRTTSLFDEANLVLGASLNVKPFDGFKAGPNSWLYILIIVLMIATQFLSMKLPQWLNKRRLENDRSFKSYDQAQAPKDPMGGMTNMMIVMMVMIAVTTPTTMSIYYTFSSFMAIVRTFLGDYMVQKNIEKNSRGKSRR